MTNAARESIVTRLIGSRSELPLSLVSALKSTASSVPLSSGDQIHSLALKSGLFHSNLFVSNALIHFYARRGNLSSARCLFLSAPLLDTASWNILLAAHLRAPRPDLHLHDARLLFDEMPQRDRVSFTTIIMGFAKHGSAPEALALFSDMMAAGVTPNEVTLSSVISSCSRLDNRAAWAGKMAHAVAVKCGVDEYLFVATNLVHVYAISSNFGDAIAVFGGMPEKSTVTWNVMLKGYTKAGRIEDARLFFQRIPVKDLVSWGTMIDGYLLADSLEDAMMVFSEMLREFEARANEVMLVDLISACSCCNAFGEGQQLHSVIVKAGLDCHSFVQATLIHFYAECCRMDLSFLQFSCGSKENISSWNALIAGFLRNNMLNAAQKTFDEMPDRDVVSWTTMVAGYTQHGQQEEALRLFRLMRSIGLQPNKITLVSLLSAASGCSSLEEGKWVHDYIDKNSIPLTDNLCAGLIGMYAKCGCIHDAVGLFNCVRESFAGVSTWNAIICGLAMHGQANASLVLFSDLLKTCIKPNSITFLGVLSACCHAGLVDVGRQHFESMKSVYHLQPTIKHYGCMVDLLGRAGRLEEAEQFIDSMQMEPDVVIWGSMLAAARMHRKVEIGEKAAERLARLDPRHGAGRVIMSNIYADANQWDEVFLLRKAMWSGRLKKDAGQSSVI